MTPYTDYVQDVSTDLTTIEFCNFSINSSTSSGEVPDSIARVNPEILLAYFCIAVFGVAGNVLVIVVIMCLPRLRNGHNVYVINLCVADILLGSNAFILVNDVYYQNWAAKNGVCSLVSFFTAFPPVAVVASMAFIAKNRYDVIMNPRRRLGRVPFRRSAVMSSTVVWIIAMAFSVPILVGWVTSRAGLFCACCIYFVENVWYSMALTVFVYLLPNAAIIYWYVRIVIHVRHSRMRILEHSSRSRPTAHASPQSLHITADLRVALQFVVLFLVFNCCYLPSTMVFWRSSTETTDSTTRSVVTLLFAVNIIANPICYFCLNGKARAEVRAAWRWRCAAAEEDGNTVSRGHKPTCKNRPKARLQFDFQRYLQMLWPSNNSHRRSPEPACPPGDLTVNIEAVTTMRSSVLPSPTGSDVSAICEGPSTPEHLSVDVCHQGANAASSRPAVIRRTESLNVDIISGDLYM